jgi:hypothetical protein
LRQDGLNTFALLAAAAVLILLVAVAVLVVY